MSHQTSHDQSKVEPGFYMIDNNPYYIDKTGDMFLLNREKLNRFLNLDFSEDVTYQSHRAGGTSRIPIAKTVGKKRKYQDKALTEAEKELKKKKKKKDMTTDGLPFSDEEMSKMGKSEYEIAKTVNRNYELKKAKKKKEEKEDLLTEAYKEFGEKQLENDAIKATAKPENMQEKLETFYKKMGGKKEEKKEEKENQDFNDNLTKNKLEIAIKNYINKKSGAQMEEYEYDIEDDEIEEDTDDPKGLGDNYDENNPKETSIKKKPIDEDMVKDLIEKEVGKATESYKKIIEDLLKEKEDAKIAEKLRADLTKEPYGLAPELVKDMSLPVLEHFKNTFEESKLFKDFTSQKQKYEPNVTAEDVNKEVLAQAEDFVEGARTRYWGNVLHYFSKQGGS